MKIREVANGNVSIEVKFHTMVETVMREDKHNSIIKMLEDLSEEKLELAEWIPGTDFIKQFNREILKNLIELKPEELVSQPAV